MGVISAQRRLHRPYLPSDAAGLGCVMTGLTPLRGESLPSSADVFPANRRSE
jgi:hypothetical protein